ncbi:MAG: molybdopterin-dependent oxidoreductase [Pseudomonadota bacterium]
MPFDPSFAGETATTCPYCGVGCGVLVKPTPDGESATVRGDPRHPANLGKLCSKGTALGETLSLDDRILFPSIKGQRASWEDAIETIATGFSKTIAKHGPDSVALYVSGQILTEDYYVANKLMKGFIGSSNIDTNSRLCMASSVVGHKRAFGTDTVPGCYADLESADLIVMVGSNFAWCHPVLHQRVLAAKEARGAKMIVIDPRQTATSEAADLHLAIKPGSDVALFNWLLWKLSQSPAMNESFVGPHTSGLSDALIAACEISDLLCRDLTGLTETQLNSFFELVRDTQKTMTIYSQGVNQSSAGSDKVNAILNTHLITGRIGKPGMGPFSITGQPNAMGGREVGGLANQLAAHMDHSPDALNRVARFWRAPNMTSGQGLKAIDMFDAVLSGQVKAIWIMATNPVVSMPQADKVKAALEACPLVVVSDVVKDSDTVQLADIVLPATAWGEKTGTVTNSERRISRQRSFLSPPGETRHDWQALSNVASAMGFDGFDYSAPHEIYGEHAALSGFENNDTRDFDISAHSQISPDAYDDLQPFQWPLPSAERKQGAEVDGHHRFFADGNFYTDDGKAHFIAVSYKTAQVLPDKTYPLILNTGRVRDHWHTMTRTGKTSRLSSHLAEPFLEMHPETAEGLGLSDADLVRVRSRSGSAVLRLRITDRVQPGDLFAPMHWTGRYSSEGRVDALVGAAHDPISGQQESKFTPVNVVSLEADWYGYGVFETEPSSEVLSRFEYWCLARAEDGWRLECAGLGNSADAVSALLGRELHSQLSLPNGGMRAATFADDVLVAAIIVSKSGPVEADRSHLASLLSGELDEAARASVLAGRAASGQSVGPIICSCEGVGQTTLINAIHDGAVSVSALGTCTKAGTNCGSCKPELRKLIADHAPEAAAQVDKEAV